MLATSPAWRLAVQQVSHPFSRTVERSDLIFSDQEIAALGLTFVADPFAVQRDGVWHLFFEQVRVGSQRGEIGLATSADLRSWTYEGAVLVEPFHVSYPHIIEADNEIYMLPEACATNSIRLYRAVSFPRQWEHCDVLLEGKAFKDSTVYRRGAGYFMLTETSYRHTHDELRMFVARKLRGPWKEHPASPLVVSDPDSGRPAGPFLDVDDNLVRLSQVCRHRYGEGVRAHVIETMDDREYREKSLDPPIIGPSRSGWNARGSHHVDAHKIGDSWIRFVDGHR
ncbi:MAG: hypothetical protein L0H84_11805 [Pseudonocardia sp.]|nr:hypothetical protein [Pseudonocardia sp.]